MKQATKPQTRAKRVTHNANPVALRISDEEFAAIQYLAAKEDRTISSVCRLAIRAWIKQNGAIEQAKSGAGH